MITTKVSQWLLNVCFIALIAYFSIATIGKIHEIYTTIVTIHNLEERLDRLQRKRLDGPGRSNSAGSNDKFSNICRSLKYG
jgi:hypothetical protein